METNQTFELTTHSSVWTFDFDTMLCTRMPRVPDEGAFSDHEGLSYKAVGTPREFEWVKPAWPGHPNTMYRFRMAGEHVRTTGATVSTEGEIPEDHLREFADE